MNDYGICQLSVIPVRKSPGSNNEMVTQILYGETFSIIKYEEKWSKISNQFDNYHGWVNNSQIRFINKKEYEFLNSNKSIYSLDILGYIINDKEQKIYLPLGSLISSCDFLKTKFVGKKTNHIKNNIIKTLKLYLNSPYLWGGRTNYGIDCSGFTQIVYKIQNIKIKRDANQQALQGDIVKRKDCNKGDLAFFGDSKKKITHVGVLLSTSEIIHAYGKIRIDKINDKGIINSETKKNTHKLIEIRTY